MLACMPSTCSLVTFAGVQICPVSYWNPKAKTSAAQLSILSSACGLYLSSMPIHEIHSVWQCSKARFIMSLKAKSWNQSRTCIPSRSKLLLSISLNKTRTILSGCRFSDLTDSIHPGMSCGYPWQTLTTPKVGRVSKMCHLLCRSCAARHPHPASPARW